MSSWLLQRRLDKTLLLRVKSAKNLNSSGWELNGRRKTPIGRNFAARLLISSQWAFVLKKHIAPGDTVVLGIEYHGSVSNKLTGLYKSTLEDAEGHKTLSPYISFVTYERRRYRHYHEPLPSNERDEK
ncbi:hypothetical protein KIN20_027432 [Parelaphostrongylus tenuis]|uniref:Uncharacterized protein n=1 Tax=Parelaphostrongylus tenuis TaxID=148309 RepID=A0AAD5QZC7_PARTN|nr:hypothetical protein KIN20_027432 [Parelaphostrongylus tenuis]